MGSFQAKSRTRKSMRGWKLYALRPELGTADVTAKVQRGSRVFGSMKGDPESKGTLRRQKKRNHQKRLLESFVSPRQKLPSGLGGNFRVCLRATGSQHGDKGTLFKEKDLAKGKCRYRKKLDASQYMLWKNCDKVLRICVRKSWPVDCGNEGGGPRRNSKGQPLNAGATGFNWTIKAEPWH